MNRAKTFFTSVSLAVLLLFGMTGRLTPSRR